jgi:hypothetical protein
MKKSHLDELYDLERRQPWVQRRGFGASSSQVVYGGHEEWRMLVRGYTGRLLSMESDRLPAFAGVARRFSSISNDQYLAGLWRKTLGVDLCWESVCSRPTRKPTTYLAPSWSWASVNKQVQWNKWLEEYGGEEFNLKLLEAKFDLASPDPFGAVTGGYLLLSAKLIQGNSGKDSLKNQVLLTCITRQHNEYETFPMYVGIELEPVSDDNTYRRIGLSQRWDNDEGESPLRDAEDTIFRLI